MVLLVNMHLIKGTDYFVMSASRVQGDSDGPLVPMIRLVLKENDVIPMVLLLQNKFAFRLSNSALQLLFIFLVLLANLVQNKFTFKLHQVKARNTYYEFFLVL